MISITWKVICDFKAQVNLSLIRPEVNPKPWGKHHYRDCRCGLTTKTGQELSIHIICKRRTNVNVTTYIELQQNMKEVPPLCTPPSLNSK